MASYPSLTTPLLPSHASHLSQPRRYSTFLTSPQARSNSRSGTTAHPQTLQTPAGQRQPQQDMRADCRAARADGAETERVSAGRGGQVSSANVLDLLASWIQALSVEAVKLMD
jgi:hypothetical protein